MALVVLLREIKEGQQRAEQRLKRLEDRSALRNAIKRMVEKAGEGLKKVSLKPGVPPPSKLLWESKENIV